MIAGNILGKTIFHTNAGGAIGAVGGFLVGYNKKANITMKQGQNFQLTLTRPLMVRRQARHPY
jgi:7-keto-8-aminopelargonate synthetase-like enzyme